MAYTAPAKDTVCVIGGLGTQADALSLNGGGATKTVWDANSPSDFMGANGGPIVSTDVAAFTTATKNFSATNIGLNVIVGTLAQVIGGDGAHVTAGIYEVTAVTDNDNIIMANVDDDGVNDTNVTVNVGGALSHGSGGLNYALQEALDQPLNNAALYNRYIYNNIATMTLPQTVKQDTYGGLSGASKVFIIGMNSTLTVEAEVIITTNQDLTVEASIDDQCLVSNQGPGHIEWRNIDFNAGGKAANLAGYCFVGDTSTDAQYTTFVNCKFRGAETDGIYAYLAYGALINCEVSFNGRYGYHSVGAVGNRWFCCSIHDNDNTGIYIRPSNSLFFGNLVYDNGKDGSGCGIYYFSTGSNTFFLGNLLYGNADDGLNAGATGGGSVWLNNASIGNGGYGFNFGNEEEGAIGYFGYNLSGANTTGDYYIDGGAGTDFTNFKNGNNVDSAQTADQIFVTITDGSEDFTPETGSDLINTGLGRTA